MVGIQPEFTAATVPKTPTPEFAINHAKRPPGLVLSREVDEARALGGDVFHPHSMQLLGREKDFQMRLRSIDASGLTLGLLEYASPVHIDSRAFSNAYQVNFPLQGHLKMAYGDQKLLTSPTSAAVHGPDMATSLEGWGEPTTMFGLKVPQNVLERELEALLGRTPERPLAFDGWLDLSSRSGREWFDAVKFLARGLREGDSILDHPLISGPASQVVVRGLLLVASNNYSHELTRQVHAPGPTYVRQAVEHIEENANQPLTLTKIAEAVHISPRALQVGFQTHLNSTPMAFLRTVRLRKVHEELLMAGPEGLVSTIARKWGFMHAGRFAIHYAQTYGRSPSATLAK
jgi:AraC-like DNA-binding protein